MINNTKSFVDYGHSPYGGFGLHFYIVKNGKVIFHRLITSE